MVYLLYHIQPELIFLFFQKIFLPISLEFVGKMKQKHVIRNVYRHGLWVSWNYVSNYYIINLLRANYVHVLYMLILINFWAFDHKGIFSHAFRSLIVFFVSLTLPWPRGANVCSEIYPYNIIQSLVFTMKIHPISLP